MRQNELDYALGISIVGLMITIALLVYERRNSELYDDLISRGRKIEEEVGVDTGQFLGRRRARLPVLKHDATIYIIYICSMIAWLIAIAIVVIWNKGIERELHRYIWP